ncbi:MAG: antitoxin [Candidatus Omnitrophica bacterium]|nr:antitoxin [Candidatus Omnitrophota bacterium]
MKRVKLTRKEKEIEIALLKGEYVNASRQEMETIASSIARRRKDAVLNIRVNSLDLEGVKKKAKKLGVPYQTFISEIIHRVAHP